MSNLWVRISLFLAEELLLGFIGLDDIADCGEYVFHHETNQVTYCIKQ